MTLGSRHRTIAWFILGMLATGIIVGLVKVMLNNAQQTEKISDTQDTSVVKANKRDVVLTELRALARDIRSCTDPVQECAKRNQKATAEAVGQLAKVNVLAATAAIACSGNIPPHTSDREAFKIVYPCVMRQMAIRQEVSKESR